MAKIIADLRGNWRLYHSGPVPYGAVAIGTVSRGGGDTGVLLKTAVGYHQLNSGVLRQLPHRETVAAVADAMGRMLEHLPRVTGQAGGRAGTGAAKRRGGSDHYRAIGALGLSARNRPRSR